MKRIGPALLVLLVVAVAGTLYFFWGEEYVYRFPESELQARLDERLPLTRRYFLIFEVTLDNPRVKLVEGEDRVRAGLDIRLNIHLGDQARPLGSSVDVSSGLRYASDTGSLYLTDPVIEHFTVEGIPTHYVERVNSVIAKAIADYFAVHPIYTLRATDARQAAVRLVLKDVVVKDRELVVTLGI